MMMMIIIIIIIIFDRNLKLATFINKQRILDHYNAG